MTMTLPVSPLVDDFEQLNQTNNYIHLEVGEPLGDGWYTPQDFQVNSGVLLDNLLERTRQKIGCDDKRLLAISVASSYAWQVSAGGVTTFLRTGRVPDFSVNNLQLHFDDGGWHDQLALRTPRFYALPDNPYANHPDAMLVDNRYALQERLRMQVEKHMRAIIEQLSAKTGMGKPGMWGVVADRLASMVIYFSNKVEEIDFVQAEINALTKVTGSPLKGKSGVMTVTHNDRTEMFLKRGACCQYYKVEGYGYCSTCPLQPADVLQNRLIEYMTQRTE